VPHDGLASAARNFVAGQLYLTSIKAALREIPHSASTNALEAF